MDLRGEFSEFKHSNKPLILKSQPDYETSNLIYIITWSGCYKEYNDRTRDRPKETFLLVENQNVNARILQERACRLIFSLRINLWRILWTFFQKKRLRLEIRQCYWIAENWFHTKTVAYTTSNVKSMKHFNRIEMIH